MSINRSQQFLYFQNKTKHYDNIKKAKATVDDKLSKQLRHTIDHSLQHSLSKSRSKSRIEPHLKKYQLDIQNEKMINRLVGIVGSKRKEIVVQGHYSRYHSVKRDFRNKNPFKEEYNRRIELENEEIVNRLGQVKPLVGSANQWMTEYQQKINHRKNLSRYLDSQRSKGSLHISTQKFIPQHYKTLLDDNEQKQKNNGKTVTIIPKQKLISFPKIMSKQKSKPTLQQSPTGEPLKI